MRVEEHFLKFTMLSRYETSFVSNTRDKISRFVPSVDDLVNEECHMTILHRDMNISRLMVYAESIDDSNVTDIDSY